MKRLKKILALALAMAMVLSMTALSAFAEEHTATDSHTLTITPTNTETDHTYEAYQIFKGVLPGETSVDQDGDGQLNSLAWGDDTSGAALITALQADSTIGADFAKATDAPTVAAVLASYSNDAAKLQKFADVVNANLGSFPKKTGTATKGNPVEIENLADGYYFVKDAANSQNGDSGTYSKFMLKIVGDTAVTAKDTKPTLEKKIKDGNNKVDISNGSIGDKVDYEVTSTVPDMTYYESYKFQINDTMTEGLTFNDDVTVKVDTATLSRVYYNGTDQKYYANAEFTGSPVTAGYTVTTTTSTTGTSFEIYIVNFIQYKDQKGKAITVNYSATINEKALDTTAETNEGNKNKAKLVYSNNPNDSGKGENGEPNPANPSGETPEDEVVTYTTGLELIKVDGDDTTKKLAGAVFELTGESKNVVIVNKEIFVEDATGEYWRLKDGTYTTQDPAGQIDGKPIDTTTYDSTTKKYKKVTTVTKDYNASSLVSEAKGVTDENGALEYTGLGEGLYTIEETQAPVGYNKLKDKIYILVQFDAGNKVFKTYKYKGTGTPTAPDGTPDSASWEELQTSGNTSKVEFDLQVENNSGAELPSTGGIGTTIFYVVGTILVIGAGVVLITRRRMDA